MKDHNSESLTPDVLQSFVDAEEGLVSRRIFVEEDIYKLELGHIFGRVWLYLAHTSQLPLPGRFATTRMGELPVVVCRAANDDIHALINVCPACDTPICRAEEGVLEDLSCPMHGWYWDLQGQPLAGSSPFALTSVPRLEVYRGWIFGCFASDVPALEDYLGDIRWGLDLLLEQGDLIVGSVSKWQINCNWKFAAESSINDIYHGMAHFSALEATGKAEGAEMDLTRSGFTVITEYGHGINAEFIEPDTSNIVEPNLMTAWRQDPSVQRSLGSFRMKVARAVVTIFPNLTISTASRQMKIWHPAGPTQTEAWLVSFVNPAEAPETQRAYSRAQMMAGPAGLYGGEEGEIWERATTHSMGVASRATPMNYQMALGHGEIIEDELSPPRIESLINEHRELWFYRNWQSIMLAQGWEDWREAHPSPRGKV